MNPHQKPQDDVVVTQEARNAAASLERLPQYKTAILEGRQDQSQRVQAFARLYLLGHEAGRRDMREEADEPLDYIDLFRIIRRAGRKDAAKAKAVHDAYSAARALPTEPLGGEQP